MNTLIKVSLTDDHTMFCQALSSLLLAYADCLKLEFVTSSGAELLNKLEACPVDVLLLDIMMPQESGLLVLERVKKKYPAMKVIMLTSITSADVIQESVRAGADGFLSKYSDEADLVAAIKSVYAGVPFYGKDIASLLNDVLLAERFDLNRLTSREREIVTLCAKGYTCCQIAERLYISVRTAETHKNSVFHKLGIHNSVELVRYAFNHGLVCLY